LSCSSFKLRTLPEVYTVRPTFWALSSIALVLVLSIRSLVDHFTIQAFNGLLLLLCAIIAIIGFTGRSLSFFNLKKDLLIFIALPVFYAIVCLPFWGMQYPNEFIRVVILLLFLSISRYFPINRYSIQVVYFLFFIVICISLFAIARGDFRLIDNSLRLNPAFLDHPNPFGLFCVMSAMLCFWIYSNTKKISPLLFGMTLLYLYLQIFNGGAFIFLVTFVYFLLLKKFGIRWVFLSSFLLPILLLLLYYTSSKFSIRIDEFREYGIIPRGGYPRSSFQWRIFMWGHLLANWLQSPWIGFGPGSSMMLYGKIETAGGGSFLAADPHNEILRILFEYGIFGSLIVSVMITHFIRLNKSTFGKIIIIAYLSASLFDNFYRSSILVCLVIYFARIGDYAASFLIPVCKQKSSNSASRCVSAEN
jgi:O-antigen ligase